MGLVAQRDRGQGYQHLDQRAGLVADLGLLIPHQLLPYQTLIPLIGQLGLFPQEQLCRGAANHLLAFAAGGLGEALIHVHETLIGEALDAAGKGTFVKRLGEALFGQDQRLVGLSQFRYLQTRLQAEQPLLG